MATEAVVVATGTKKIGIVIHANAMLFSNGITQNAYFLYQCLERCGYTPQFLCDEANPAPFQYNRLPLQQIVVDDDTVFKPGDFSLILTVTRKITPRQYEMFKARNIKVVGIVCGNHFAEDPELFLYSFKSGGSFHGKEDACDELWTIPSLTQFHTYLHTLRKVPVYSIPHLWNPCILEQRATHLSKVSTRDLIYDVAKHTHAKIDIVILEPNLGVVKHAWVPIIASEHLHMKKPELINNVYVFNFPGHPMAHSMTQTLSLGDKLRPFKRLEMDEILAYFSKQATIPIFLSYHQLNHLNYIYYELLHYGYPLVHNSDMLDGCGYYYNENNIEMCVNSIIYAHKHHNARASQYRDDATRYLERVNPLNTDVCNQITEKIKSVLSS
jgi:hypothetical protein